MMMNDDYISGIVTQFLLNTCRILQPSEYHVQAAELCGEHTQRSTDDAVVEIPLTAGSVAEFYIQPMLPHIGDIDIMYHRNDELAIPEGHRPPSQLPAEFHSRVKVYEITDSEFPAYVYLRLICLLIENDHTGNYDAVPYTRLEITSYATDIRDMDDRVIFHGPAQTVINFDTHNLNYDIVRCLPCLRWPTQAVYWPARLRYNGWPDSATVDRVVSNGCDVVCVAHRQCRQHEWMSNHQYRLSFSRAEIILINSWMPVQQIVYHMLRVFVKTELQWFDNSEAMPLSNYHIKTLMMWACEMKPRCWWVEELNVVRICVELLHILSDWLTYARCPHYFVNNCNLFHYTVNFESQMISSITVPVLVKWFINNYIDRCAHYCPVSISQLLDDLSTNMKLQNAVSAIVDWRLNSALQDVWRIHVVAESSVLTSFFSVTLTTGSRNYSNNYFSEVGSHIHNVLDDDMRISKIVTKFLVDTCVVHEKHVPLFCNWSTAHLTEDKVVFVPLKTGSAIEFYIQPMLSCVSDIDIMSQVITHLAIPDGYPPNSQLPVEFRSHVEAYEIINDKYPGYVKLRLSYLLTKNTHNNNYDIVQYVGRQYLSHNIYSTNKLIGIPERGYYDSPYFETDIVICIRCLYWPTQAAVWPRRYRNYDWPGPATVQRVIDNGCHVVNKVHPLCRQDEWKKNHQWRLSFSIAEIVLTNSWITVQQIAYHALRVLVKTEQWIPITDCTGSKILSNYQIKTFMLWSCELNPRSWWLGDFDIVKVCVKLLHTFSDWLSHANCPHYFVNNSNLFDHRITTHDVQVFQNKLMSLTENELSQWFLNKYIRRCARFCPDSVSRLFDDISTKTKLQNAVSAIVSWRQNSADKDTCTLCNSAIFNISAQLNPLTVQTYDCAMKEYENIDSCLCVYFTAVACLHAAVRTARNDLSDELADVLVAIVGKYISKRRYSNQHRSIILLRQATLLMKGVKNTLNTNVQTIEIELSKTYLHRALRCKDSDSDSIYCLANVYLAVLYYTTGRYQTAIDHCTLNE